MHPREVAEVGEVLELPGGVGAPRVRPGRDHRPAVVRQLGHVGERPARILERDPDEAVALDALERADPGLLRDAGRIGELRDERARAVGAVMPAVVRADDVVAVDRAERDGRPAVDAEIGDGVGRPAGVAVERERLAEEHPAQGLVLELRCECDRVPAGAKGRDVGGGGRCFHRCISLPPMMGRVESAAVGSEEDGMDLAEIYEQFSPAFDEFAKGNPEPVKALYSHRDDATLANPFGPAVRGWDEVIKDAALHVLKVPRRRVPRCAADCRVRDGRSRVCPRPGALAIQGGRTPASRALRPSGHNDPSP